MNNLIGIVLILGGTVLLIKNIITGVNEGFNAENIISPIGFVVVGLGFIMWGRFNKKHQPIDIMAKTKELLNENVNNEVLKNNISININRKSSVVAAVVNFDFYLNGNSIGMLKNGGNIIVSTSVKKNIISSPTAQYLIQFEIIDNNNINVLYKYKDQKNISINIGKNVI